MKKQVRFLVNPVSGGRQKTHLPELIRKYADHGRIEPEVCVTASGPETTGLAKEAVALGYDAVVAVGGDGTINNVAAALIDTPVALGIIPMGSGNGYARALRIPLKEQAAIRLVNYFRTGRFDTGMVNDTPFVNLAGVGFDAHVAGLFTGSVKRGLLTYTQIVLSEFAAYKPRPYRLALNGETFDANAFLITVCIGSQFGNNAYIAPRADMQDGLFSMTLIRKGNLLKAPGLVYRIFTRSLHGNANVRLLESSRIRLVREAGGPVNIDGESVPMERELLFEIKPASLNVIVP